MKHIAFRALESNINNSIAPFWKAKVEVNEAGRDDLLDIVVKYESNGEALDFTTRVDVGTYDASEPIAHPIGFHINYEGGDVGLYGVQNYIMNKVMVVGMAGTAHFNDEPEFDILFREGLWYLADIDDGSARYEDGKTVYHSHISDTTKAANYFSAVQVDDSLELMINGQFQVTVDIDDLNEWLEKFFDGVDEVITSENYGRLFG